MKKYNDAETLILLQRSDERGINYLYSSYWKLLYNLAAQKTGSLCDAQDIVQELFIDTWKNRKNLVLTSTFRSYLVSCLYLKIFNYFRNNGVRRQHLDDFRGFLQQAGNALIDADGMVCSYEADFEEMLGFIDEVIARMPAQMQQVFVMRYRRKQQVSAISEELSISPYTVKKHLSNAMARLRQEAGMHRGGYQAGLLFLFWIFC